MLMGRIFSYHDTHLHRIGPNYEQLPINAPLVEVHSYNRDAQMTYRHAGAQPVYAPNSYDGPQADPTRGADLGWAVEASELGRCGGVLEVAGVRVRRLVNDCDVAEDARAVGCAAHVLVAKLQGDLAHSGGGLQELVGGLGWVDHLDEVDLHLLADGAAVQRVAPTWAAVAAAEAEVEASGVKGWLTVVPPAHAVTNPTPLYRKRQAADLRLHCIARTMRCLWAVRQRAARTAPTPAA
jgi:hypothetical protein